MKFTLDWLKDHLDTSENLNTITDTLTNIGLEIESVEDKSEIFKNFTVAKVLKAEKHPDADKLKVCQVETINGNYQVVCGAPNAKEGMLGIFAPENSYIPGTDLHLKKTKIRGVESCGMLVSEREMGISDEHDGIIEVKDNYKIGDLFSKIFAIDEPIIEINNAVFIADKSIYKKYSDRIGKNPYLLKTSKINSFDIDWETDFDIAEQIYLNNVRN